VQHVCCAQAVTSPPVKDNNITLSLPGIVGSFTGVPNAPPNSIEAFSLTFGASCSFNIASNTCSAANVSSLNIAKVVDGASPLLFLALVRHTLFPTATVQFWERPVTGTNYVNTYTITLTEAIAVSIQNNVAEGSSPLENVSFAFRTIVLHDNVYGSVSCYNVATNTSTTTGSC